MKVFFKPTFIKDLKKLPAEVYEEVYLLCTVEFPHADSLRELRHHKIKYLAGFKDYYRIRVGNYRIGFKNNENQEIEFMRVLHRKDIYKYFP